MFLHLCFLNLSYFWRLWSFQAILIIIMKEYKMHATTTSCVPRGAFIYQMLVASTHDISSGTRFSLDTPARSPRTRRIRCGSDNTGINVLMAPAGYCLLLPRAAIRETPGWMLACIRSYLRANGSPSRVSKNYIIYKRCLIPRISPSPKQRSM